MRTELLNSTIRKNQPAKPQFLFGMMMAMMYMSDLMRDGIA